MRTRAVARIGAVALGFLGLAITAGSGVPPLDTASPCDDDPYEPDQYDLAASNIEVGAHQDRLLCDEDWIQFIPTRNGAVYTVEARNLTGTGSARVQTYDCAYCSQTGGTRLLVGSADLLPGASSRLELRPGPTFLPFDAGVPAWARVSRPAGGYGPEGSYELTVRCASGCPPVTSLFFPTVEHRGETRTDVRLFNPGPAPAGVQLFLSRPGVSQRSSVHVVVPAESTFDLDDVLATAFNVADGIGSLEVRSESEVTASSRTWRGAGPGRVGQFQPARAGGRGLATQLILLAAGASGSRTALGISETAGSNGTAYVTIGDVTLPFPLPAYGSIRIEDVFATFGVPPSPGTQILISAVPSGARSIAYAEVTDLVSGDSYVVPGIAENEKAYELIVPAAASANGWYARYRTTLALSRGQYGGAGDVEIELLPMPGSPGGGLRTFHIPARESLVLDDVVALFGGTSGALRIRSLGGYAIGVSRTDSDRGGIATSEVVPVLPLGALGSTRQGRATALLLGSGPSARVNVGLLSLDATTATLDVFDRSGALAASDTHSLSPGVPIQVNDVARTLGVDPATLGRIEVRATARKVRLVAHAIVLDNETNDFSFVPAAPVGALSEELEVRLPGGVPLTLVRIPPGRFLEGSPEEEQGRDDDETRHTVTLTRATWMGKVELTRRQWGAVMGQPDPSDLPVTGVSWTDVAGTGGFLERLNLQLAASGQAPVGLLRLPTEAEWERAARGGTDGRFSFPDDSTCDDACGPCPAAGLFAWSCGDAATPSPVARKRPNPYALYDMHGNVWEWVADRYAPFTAEAAVDPAGPAAGDARVVRGGGFSSDLRLARSANRFSYPPDGRYPHVGFRVAMGVTAR